MCVCVVGFSSCGQQVTKRVCVRVRAGGGFALAEGSKATGLSAMIGAQLTGLHGAPAPVVLLAVVLVTQFITEFTSNVAIANLILPVLANMVSAHLPRSLPRPSWCWSHSSSLSSVLLLPPQTRDQL